MRRTKHGNVKVVLDGHTFDSKREAARYAELKLMQRAGLIRDLELQKKYVLIPAQYESFPRYGKAGKRLKDGRKMIEQECAYYADFVYVDAESGRTVVEDAKGYDDPSSAPYAKYVIKRKLMLQIYGIRIQEV